jgi:FKBP-type peptidyl-prolyl cis-trans isomerase FklB
MKPFFIAITFLCAGQFASAQGNPKQVMKAVTKNVTRPIGTRPLPSGLKTTMDTISYIIGVNIGSNLNQQGLGNVNTALMQKGLDDVFKKRPLACDPAVGNVPLNNYMQKQNQLRAEKEKVETDAKLGVERARSKAFLDSNKKRPGVITLPDGLQYEVLRKGPDTTGMPKLADTVIAHYAGSLINGSEFDNSYKRGDPLTIAVKGVIPGWTEILQLMHVGDKFKVYIPSNLGYGDGGAGGAIPGAAALIFEMELLGIKPGVVK